MKRKIYIQISLIESKVKLKKNAHTAIQYDSDMIR